MKYAEVQNRIGGAFVSPQAPLLDVYDPSSGKLLSRVPLSSAREVDAAVAAARAALPGWSATPIKERVQVLYRYKALLEHHIDELAALVTEENGKIASEARAEVLKSAELTEFACSLPQIVTGEVLEVSHAVQLPAHGAQLDDSQRHRPGQLHDPQAERAGATQCSPHRGAARGGGTAVRSAPGGERGA
jgi:malonate-semialdehyde dehydrogenase (acetylating)/methylmalonate-semialdehyde dehydrogenase